MPVLRRNKRNLSICISWKSALETTHFTWVWTQSIITGCTYSTIPAIIASILLSNNSCGPMLVTVPNMVWLLVHLLWLCLWLPHLLPSACLVRSFRAHGIFERSTKVGWHISAGTSSDGQVMWVARLSSNSNRIEKTRC